MGIRMLHRWTAPSQANADSLTRVPLPPVPAFAATASTARIRATFATALRDTAEELRRRLAPHDPALRGPSMVDSPPWRHRTALALGRIGPARRAPASRAGETTPWRSWADLARALLPEAARRAHPADAGEPASGRSWADVARALLAQAARLAPASRPGDTSPWQQWADLARGYLALALTLLPRPRPVQTVTVFVAAPETVTGRPYGPAPRRRHRDDRGPGPDATA